MRLLSIKLFACAMGEELPVDSYRIKNSTVALFDQDGRLITCTLPIGAIVATDERVKGTLIEVIWNERHLLVFARELQTRAEKLDPKTAPVDTLVSWRIPRV